VGWRCMGSDLGKSGTVSRKLTSSPAPTFPDIIPQAFNASLSSTSAAETYNPSNAYIYTGIQVRYFTAFQSYIYPVFLEAIGIASAIVSTDAAALDIDRQSLSTAQLKVLGYPASSTFNNPAPFPFTVRVLVGICATCGGEGD
jgi:hypothetical protein